MKEITPSQFQHEWSGGRRPFLLDVRQPEEWDICNLAEFGALLIPLGELTQRLNEIPSQGDIVVYCRSGGRSGQAQRLLQNQGYPQVQNLSGGILRWSDEVDSSKTPY